MESISFDLEGMDSVVKGLEEAAKKFPATTEMVLKKESQAVAKDIRSNVRSRIKGHRSKKSGSEKKYLERSFTTGKVIKTGTKYTGSVMTSAPHYHLVELGHDLYTHRRKNKRGKGKIGTERKIGHVDGKKIVAEVMAKRSEHSSEIAEAILDKILEGWE